MRKPVRSLLLIFPFLVAPTCPRQDDVDTEDSGTSSGTCACEDEGTSLEAGDGCEDWTDAEECSGWNSVVGESGGSTGDSYASGTALTGYGCTITLTCP